MTPTNDASVSPGQGDLAGLGRLLQPRLGAQLAGGGRGVGGRGRPAPALAVICTSVVISHIRSLGKQHEALEDCDISVLSAFVLPVILNIDKTCNFGN